MVTCKDTKDFGFKNKQDFAGRVNYDLDNVFFITNYCQESDWEDQKGGDENIVELLRLMKRCMAQRALWLHNSLIVH